jgi:muramoyltetrapeptide carboxypeptidase
MRVDWRPLEPDEPIGVAALSGVVDPARLRDAVDRLRAFGRPVILAPNLERAHYYLAGDDGERVDSLRDLLARGARVVLAARGGSGATRILGRLPWEELVAEGVVFAGFSDLTAVLNPLLDRGGAAQVHGPMVATGRVRSRDVDALMQLLELPAGSTWEVDFGPRAVVRPGVASGPARGGNLAVLTALVGTPYAPRLDGAVVFLEDVSEPLYRLDRMLTQLSTSGTFRGVKALVCGSLCDCPGAEGVSSRWRDLLLEAVPEEVPVVDGLPFGHGERNTPFPLGVTADVDTRNGRVVWSV